MTDPRTFDVLVTRDTTESAPVEFMSGPDSMTATLRPYGLSFNGRGPKGGYVSGPSFIPREAFPSLAAMIGGAVQPPANGPYRPDLAEAFRQGARELQIDALDIAPGAVVEPAEGGAFVTCRVYVSDAQRLPMPGEYGVDD